MNSTKKILVLIVTPLVLASFLATNSVSAHNRHYEDSPTPTPTPTEVCTPTPTASRTPEMSISPSPTPQSSCCTATTGESFTNDGKPTYDANRSDRGGVDYVVPSAAPHTGFGPL